MPIHLISPEESAGFNIFEALTAVNEILLSYGGHPAAAGVSLNNENIVLL